MSCVCGRPLFFSLKSRLCVIHPFTSTFFVFTRPLPSIHNPLLPGQIFSDHMLEADWSREAGWEPPRIKQVTTGFLVW